MRISGAGTTADIEQLDFLGDFEVLDGAVVDIRGQGGLAFGLGTSLLVRDARVLLPRFTSVSGTVVVDGGTLVVDQEMTFRGGQGRLEGSGVLEVVDPLGTRPNLALDGTLAPGIGGAGHIHVDGIVDLSVGWFEVDLGGTELDQYDRLTATGSVLIGDRTRFEVSQLAGFSASVGDRFDLIVADQVTASTPSLLSLFDLPQLSTPDSFFVARILDGPAQQTLALGIASAIRAEWTGGIGSYTDPGRWAFSDPPPLASFPSNDLASVFDVVVAGESGSAAALASDVVIGSLEIGEGNTLDLAGGHSILLESIAGRTVNGEVRVDGLLNVGGAGVGAQLLSEGDLRVSGEGHIALADAVSGGIAAAFGTVELTIEDGVTVSGAGSILETRSSAGTGPADRLVNHGVIDADGQNALRVAQGENFGTLRATGSGGLELGAITNSGAIEVGPGSSLETVLGNEVRNVGTLSIQGPGTSARVELKNFGQIEIGDGALVDLVGYQQQAGRLAIRDTSAVGSLGFDGVTGGAILLDDAEFRFRGGNVPIDFRSTRLEGSGRWVLRSAQGDPGVLRLRFGSVLAPGTSEEAGQLEFDGSIVLESGLAMDVFGPGAADRVVVSGDFSFGPFFSATVGFSGGYVPTAGDTFELLRAGSISGLTAPGLDRFDLPALDGQGLYYDLALTAGLLEDVLELGILAPIAATWTGGDGSYEDPTRWSFDRAPQFADFPDGGLGDVFDVSLGGSGSVVTLAAPASVFAMQVGSQEELVIGSGGELLLVAPRGNLRSGGLRVDGLLRLDGGRLSSDVGFSIDGEGILELGGAGSEVSIAGANAGPLSIGSGAAVRGAGRIIAPGGIVNEGLLEARSGTLQLEGGPPNPFPPTPAFAVQNRGHVIVDAGADLEVYGTLESTGSIEVRSGGRLATAGSGFPSPVLELKEGGALVVEQGGTVESSLVQSGEGAITELGGVLDLGSRGRGSITAGTFVLSGGRVVGSSIAQFILGEQAVLTGNGVIAIDSFRTTGWSGTVAPGVEGIGAITFEDDLLFSSTSRIVAEVGGGEDGALHDVLTVVGTSFLEGQVVLETVEGYAPELGDFFDVLVATTISTSLLDVVLPAIEGELSWLAHIVSGPTGDRLRFQVVPEPGSALLLGLGLVCVAARRRTAGTLAR
ncbi:MAG: PEP-CTERM sorting domain-containing protein [Myxococcota bacterium]